MLNINGKLHDIQKDTTITVDGKVVSIQYISPTCYNIKVKTKYATSGSMIFHGMNICIESIQFEFIKTNDQRECEKVQKQRKEAQRLLDEQKRDETEVEYKDEQEFEQVTITNSKSESENEIKKKLNENKPVEIVNNTGNSVTLDIGQTETKGNKITCSGIPANAHIKIDGNGNSPVKFKTSCFSFNGSNFQS